MADEATPTPETAPTPGTAGASTPKTFTQEQVNDLIAREKGQVQNRFADYDDLKSKASKFDELEQANQTELERITGERDTLKGDAETWKSKALRYEAAAKAGLDLDLAARIQGGTPEEMETDAKALAERFGSGAAPGREPVGAGGARTTAPAGDMNSFIRSGSRRG